MIVNLKKDPTDLYETNYTNFHKVVEEINVWSKGNKRKCKKEQPIT